MASNYSFDVPCDALTSFNHSRTPYAKLNTFWDLYNGVPFNLTVNVIGFLVSYIYSNCLLIFFKMSEKNTTTCTCLDKNFRVQLDTTAKDTEQLIQL